jgi:hypothetical protein
MGVRVAERPGCCALCDRRDPREPHEGFLAQFAEGYPEGYFDWLCYGHARVVLDILDSVRASAGLPRVDWPLAADFDDLRSFVDALPDRSPPGAREEGQETTDEGSPPDGKDPVQDRAPPRPPSSPLPAGSQQIQHEISRSIAHWCSTADDHVAKDLYAKAVPSFLYARQGDCPVCHRPIVSASFAPAIAFDLEDDDEPPTIAQCALKHTWREGAWNKIRLPEATA